VKPGCPIASPEIAVDQEDDGALLFNPESGEVQNLPMSSERSSELPAWSPDSKFVAYMTKPRSSNPLKRIMLIRRNKFRMDWIPKLTPSSMTTRKLNILTLRRN